MKTLVVLALWTAALTAHAQTVYKCTVDGKVSYNDVPCPAGAASAAMPEVPTAPQADPLAARDLKRQQKEAATLQQARLKREEKDERDNARASQAAAVQRKKCGKLKLSKQWADEDARRAAGPATEAAKLRARRAGESYALECPK